MEEFEPWASRFGGAYSNPLTKTVGCSHYTYNVGTVIVTKTCGGINVIFTCRTPKLSTKPVGLMNHVYFPVGKVLRHPKMGVSSDLRLSILCKTQSQQNTHARTHTHTYTERDTHTEREREREREREFFLF